MKTLTTFAYMLTVARTGDDDQTELNVHHMAQADSESGALMAAVAAMYRMGCLAQDIDGAEILREAFNKGTQPAAGDPGVPLKHAQEMRMLVDKFIARNKMRAAASGNKH